MKKPKLSDRMRRLLELRDLAHAWYRQYTERTGDLNGNCPQGEALWVAYWALCKATHKARNQALRTGPMKTSTRDQLLVLLAQEMWRCLDAFDVKYITYLSIWRAIMSLTPRKAQ